MPDASTLATPLAWALAYAGKGWHVLPLMPREKRPAGRLVPRGALDATTDQDLIRNWWREMPDANVGIAMAPSGLVALDIDPRNGGMDTFDALQAAHGSLRSDVMAFTGGGGEHHVFVVPPGHQVSLPGTLGPGVDVKANGYICVEPSVHPSGGRYGWEASSSPLDGVAPSSLPDWLRGLRVAAVPVAADVGTVPVDAEQARDVREALYALDADDYHEWVQAGMAMHSTRWGQAAYAMWAAWSQQSVKFDAAAVREKWASFRAPGERGSGLTVAWVFQQAQQRGWVNPRKALRPAAAITQDEIEAIPPEFEGATRPGQAGAAVVQAATLPFLSLAQLQESARGITWLCKGVIPSESVGVMFGGSGTFKSFIALDAALHVAHGLPWLGRKTKRAPVVIVAAEGGAGLWRRIDAWHRYRGIVWDEAQVYVVPAAIDLGSDCSRVVEAALSAGIEPGLVVVDTLSQTFSGEENSAAEVSAYLRELGLWFRESWRCAVLVIHHTGHQATERPRGSSAIRANVDFMLGVQRDEKEMLATVSCAKQKDGELFKDQAFALSVCELERDDDGDPVTTLVARAVMSDEERQVLVQHEAASGRSGRHALIMGLAQPGLREHDLRKAFYEDCGIDDQDGRRQAYHRALGWAKRAGMLEIAQGVVIVLKGGAA